MQVLGSLESNYKRLYRGPVSSSLGPLPACISYKIIISILTRTPRDDLKRLVRVNDKADGLATKDIRLVRAMPTIGTVVHESATLIGDLSSPVEKEPMELAMWMFNLVRNWSLA
ncbi:hypothetical protein BDV24DRAFT_19359 [Aspergillus arachidicola]|uniref:Uncharacterized protein n=1 Tax=Aspergillus arachidicola TaxID=656916 RepID=A0A5N6XRG8_9EURO|nr:hypothetical protein BDV24DRAFT_19359 [Aspergillus arachidicola]